jgi:hypothetical protein
MSTGQVKINVVLEKKSPWLLHQGVNLKRKEATARKP